MSVTEPFDTVETDAARGSRWSRIRSLERERLRTVAVPALALSAAAIAIASQLLLTRIDSPIPKPGYGFLLAAVLMGVAMYLQGAGRAESREADAGGKRFQLPIRWEIALVAAVMVLAGFFRFWRFLEFPPGVWYDEAVTSADAIWMRDNDLTTIWRETNFGRATLFLYLLIASYELLGYTVFAMRFVPAVAGLAAVFAFYFLARWLLGPVPALVATALLAVSRWAVTFSRVSWEAALQPLFEIMAVYFFVRALETRGRLGYFFWFMAGGSLAAGIYTYLAFRFVPFVMAAFLLYIAVTKWDLLWKNRIGIVVYAASFLIVIAPLANFALNNQDQFLERTRAVNVFKEVDEKDTYEPLRSNVRESVQMINIAGDHNGRHNLPNAPMADELTGALFVLGFAAALISYRSWRRGTLPIWLVIMLLPGIFTISIENPSAIRGVGAIPPLFLLAGLSVAVVYSSLERSRAGLVTFGALALALVAGSTALNYHDIFERQANSKLVWEAFTPGYRLSAEVVAERAEEDRVLVARPYLGHPLLPILARDLDFDAFNPGEHLVLADDGRDAVVILDGNQDALRPHLEALYPNLEVEETRSPFGDALFATITIPAADIAAIHQLDLTYVSGGSTRSEKAPLDRQWTSEDVASGPVTATWEGFLWSPGTTYRFEADDANAEVSIDGERADAGAVELSPGEHRVRIVATITRPGSVNVTVATDREERSAAGVLHGTSVGEGGFEVILHDGGEFTDDVAMIGRVPFAVPIMPSARQAVEYRGEIDVPVQGTYTFALDGASSSQLLVNGELVVDNGGSHARRRVEASVVLPRGTHELTIQYLSAGNADWSLHVETPSEGFVLLDGREISPPSEPYTPPAIVNISADAEIGQGVTISELSEPFGIAALPDGTVAVSSGRIIGLLDEDLTLVRTLEPDVAKIVDLAATDDGRLVLVDNERKSLVVLTIDGEETLRLDDAFASVAGVDVVGDRAIVASPAGGNIYDVSLLTGEVTTLPVSSGDNPERARQPSDVAVGEDGTIFIADFEGQKILISPDGESAVVTGGVRGTGVQLPHLAVGGKLLYATEGVNDRIIVKDVAGGHRGVFVFPSRHGGTRPTGIDVDRQGRILVAGASGVIFRLVVEIPPRTQAELDALQ